MIRRVPLQHRISAALLGAFLAAFGGAAPAAQAASPAALVEDISPGIKGPGAFDYVSAGTQIVLGASGTLTLGYLSSCIEENIAGGTVTVGTEQSAVVGGSVQRKTVHCASRAMQLSAEQSGKSGGLVFRKPPGGAAAPAADIVIIHGQAPVIALPKAGRVVFDRMDAGAAPIALDLPGKPVDLATRKVSFEAGGIYRATYGARSIQFRIVTDGDDTGSLLARLIQF
jgi:hypothetical protein